MRKVVDKKVLDFSEVYWCISTEGCEESHGIWKLSPYMEKVMEDYIVSGPKELKDNEIIISKYIVESGDDVLLGNTSYVDGEEFIGDEITLSVEKTDFLTGSYIETKEYTFKIVGVYDSIAAGDKGDAYVSENMAKEISENFTYFESENNNEAFYKYAPVKSIRVVVEKYEDIGEVQSEIYKIFEDQEQDSYLVQHQLELKENVQLLIEGIRLVCNFISIYLIINAAIGILLYIKETLENRKREFGILKAIGYNTSQISWEIGKEMLLVMSIPLAITFGVGFVAIKIINDYISENVSVYWQSMKVDAANMVSVVIVIIAIAVPLMGQWMAVKKISKLEPMEAMK